MAIAGRVNPGVYGLSKARAKVRANLARNPGNAGLQNAERQLTSNIRKLLLKP